MIKQLANSDITVRPFKTYKNWEIQSIDSASVNLFGESTYFSDKITISEGISCSGIFYDSGSPYYNPITEPINANGEYKRITYSVARAMFYNDYNNPLKRFGVEYWDKDPITGIREHRSINKRVLVARIGNAYWGETIKPNSVRIADGSSLHDPYIIVDDGNTNLVLTGSQFPDFAQITPHRNLESKSYWDSSSGQFFYNDTLITYPQAIALRETGEVVTYTPDSASWKYDLSTERDYYEPDNERFGYSVSAWYKYILAGSPMDGDSFSTAKQGHAQIFKYDVSSSAHRFVKKFYSPFTTNGLSQEFGFDNSLLVQLEDESFLYLDISGSCPTSSLMDEFGYSVSVKDDFAAIGAPNGDECVTCNPHAGFAYVYGKYKGGADNWGLVSILEGSGSNARFGEAVSVDGDIVAVGAPGVNGGSGVVYVFRRKIYPNKVSSSFDSCATIPTASFWNYIVDQNYLCERIVAESGEEIVGENGAPEFLLGSGSVILGDYSWQLETVLSSSVSAVGDYFGSSLEVNSDRIIVGCRKMNGKGYVALFTASFSTDTCPTASWGEYRIFRGNDDSADLDPLSPFNGVTSTLSYDGFGRSVTMDGDHIAVCSYYDKSVGTPLAQSIGAAYFYSFANIRCLPETGSLTQSFDCALRYKTYGDRSTIYNNNFARCISLRGTRAVVGTLADKIHYSASYVTESNEFIFENESVTSTNAYDQLNVLGRISLYDFDPKTLKWDVLKVEKRNKEFDVSSYSYGWSACLSDYISGSKFLVVGSPVFNYASGSDSNYNYVIDKNYQRSGNFPMKYSGSLFVYDMDTLETDPQIGNVFYKNGQIILTNTASNYLPIMTGTGSKGFSMVYQGEHTIFEHEYLINIGSGEFNYSTNPSSLVNYPIIFDVNNDGIFDFTDVDLILRFLNKQKFYDVQDVDDNGVIIEGDTLTDESWWNNDIIMTEAGDVWLTELRESHLESTGSMLNEYAFNYIQTQLVDTGLLDIDGNGRIDLRDGYLLLNYWSNSMTTEVIGQYTDEYSTRRYYIEFKEYISQYTGELNGFLVDPNFHQFADSSSYDPTGSYLAPTITTIGLYSNNQLVAVSKLSRPLKNIVDWPLNIIVRFDT